MIMFSSRRKVAVCLGCLFSFLTLLPAAEDWQPALRVGLNAMADQLTATLKPWPVPERVFYPEDHGAVADGRTINTLALQQTIDACSSAGGGTVWLKKGDYVTGTLELKSGVMLRVDKEARLLGSLDLADYPRKELHYSTVGADSPTNLKRSLIFAQGCGRVGICGEGVIDGRSSFETFSRSAGAGGGSPLHAAHGGMPAGGHQRHPPA